MEFFIDGEFYEDGERIWPLALAIVAADGKSLYRVYGDTLCDPRALSGIRNHHFLMTQVVPNLSVTAQRIIGGSVKVNQVESFNGHPEIAPRWTIRADIDGFIGQYGAHRREHELWAYYGAYDHVMLAQTFGTMMQLPAAVPMFTRELMQLEADVNERRARYGLAPVERPAKLGEHNALVDATWNLLFWRALRDADPVGDATAWMIDASADLVTVPSRVFVAGYERLTSQGPNEGLTDEGDEERAAALWNALL